MLFRSPAGHQVGSFISGDHFLYDFVDQHPRLTVRRSRYTNDPDVYKRQPLDRAAQGGNDKAFSLPRVHIQDAPLDLSLIHI